MEGIEVMDAPAKRYVDLHTHTEYSDGIGVWPRDIVRGAKERGIDVVAVSDHDNIAGYEEGRLEAEKVGIILLPAAEITTEKYHLLSLNFNPYDEDLLDFLEYSKDFQRRRSEVRIDRLRDYGMPMTMEKLERAFPTSARFGKYSVYIAMKRDSDCVKIIDHECEGMDDGSRYNFYLGEGGVVGKVNDIGGVDEKEAINIVHAAGGFIGLAHPPKDVDHVDELNRLVELGIDFLEIQPNHRNGSFDSIDYDFVEEYARLNELPISYGSDYHGPTVPRKLLRAGGENVLTPELEELLNEGFIKLSSGVCC